MFLIFEKLDFIGNPTQIDTSHPFQSGAEQAILVHQAFHA
jgi:hypothetical protein